MEEVKIKINNTQEQIFKLQKGGNSTKQVMSLWKVSTKIISDTDI